MKVVNVTLIDYKDDVVNLHVKDNHNYFANGFCVSNCHLFASEDSQGGGELMGIMMKLCNAKYRIGTTGSLKDSKVHHLILEGIFGQVYQTTTTREMMDSKRAAELFIKCLQLQYPDEERKNMRKKTYQEEMEFLISHTSRNKFIRNLALSLKGNTLILFERVEKHGKILHKMIDSAVENGRKVFFVHGATPTDERNMVRKIVDNQKEQIVLEFDKVVIRCNTDTIVQLTDGTNKKADIITKNDDVDSTWIINMSKRS